MALAERTTALEVNRSGNEPGLETETAAYVVEVRDDPGDIEEEWRLLEDLPQLSVHQSFAWCSAWARNSGYEPLIIIGRSGAGPHRGKIAFILPMCVERKGPVRIARYMGSFLNNINFGIYSEDFLSRCDRKVMDEIMASIRRQVRGVDLLLFDRHPLIWRGLVHPFSHLTQKQTQDPTYQVSLSGGFEAVLSRSNGKRRRKKFRTSEKRLDALGGYDYVHAETPDEALELLQHFYRQKGQRFEQRNIDDIFKPAEIQSFLGQLVRDSLTSNHNALVLRALRLRDRNRTPCAIAVLSEKGGHTICQFSSIAAGATESASPGELLFHRMIEDACDANAELFDFGMGDERFKRSWCDLKTQQFYFDVACTPAGHIAAATLSAITSAKRVVKSNPRLNAGARRMREVFGRRKHR